MDLIFTGGERPIRGCDGPRAGLQPLKWEPGVERPACAGLPGPLIVSWSDLSTAYDSRRLPQQPALFH